MKNKKGFTLIEMLVVIAVIAILVAIVVPTITNASAQAKAATDAANLRTIVGQLNIILVSEEDLPADVVSSLTAPVCKTVPGATLKVLYRYPGFIAPYFVTSSGEYYGLDYLSDIASSGTTSKTLTPPAAELNDEWFTVGG